MRDSLKLANLNELMGEGFEHRTKLTLEDLPKLLGHKMPEISYDRIGRIRLHHALQQRFGSDYVNMPHIRDLLKQHEEAMRVTSQAKALRRAKRAD